MASVTYTAILPNGVLATRSTKTMQYVAVLAVADPGKDNWGARSWHLTESAAYQAANVSYNRALNTKVVTVEITKVVGKTIPGTELDTIKARIKDGTWNSPELAAADATKLWGGDLLADVAVAVAEIAPEETGEPTEADLDAASDFMAEILAPAQTVEEATELLADVNKAMTEALAEAKADAAAAKAELAAMKMSLAQKREMGTRVHELMRGVLAELPEGIDAEEAAAVVETWLLYIPKNRADGQQGMSADQKRVLGSAARKLAEQALAELPAGVAPAAAVSQLDTWFTYIPQAK